MKLSISAATIGPIGYLPVCPGTFGSIPGILVAWLISFIPPLPGIMVISIFFVIAVYTAEKAVAFFKRDDPGQVVIDEALGMTIALFAIEMDLLTTAVSFILFRLMDILKPPPVRQIDNMMKGGLGIVMDDVFAGVMANLILRIVVMAMGT